MGSHPKQNSNSPTTKNDIPSQNVEMVGGKKQEGELPSSILVPPPPQKNNVETEATNQSEPTHSSVSELPSPQNFITLLHTNKEALLKLRKGEKTKLYYALILERIKEQIQLGEKAWLYEICLTLSTNLKIKKWQIHELICDLSNQHDLLKIETAFKTTDKFKHRQAKQITLSMDLEKQKQAKKIIEEAQKIITRITTAEEEQP